MEILISNQQKVREVKAEEVEIRLERILRDLACVEDCELSVLITDDEQIAQLNQQYLGRVGPTNVLAFAMSEGEAAGLNPGLLGDVVVSVETAWREAQDNGLDGPEHFYRLLIHGILHLLGYDHVNDEDQARRMEELTEKLLAASAP